MENAREEWDRAHALKCKVLISYRDYVEMVKHVGLAICESEVILAAEKPPNPAEWRGDLETFDKILEHDSQAVVFDELEDNDLICGLLEEPLVVNEEELDARYRV